jgi:3',5'-nucleoside bisphosphate phosphatase
MIANLHMHSRYSDGSLWPEALAAAAAASPQGLELAALTDHDDLHGSGEFAAACAALGLACLPACEIDVSVPEIGYRSELLAYFPQGRYAATGALLAAVLEARTARISGLAARAAALFGRPELGFEGLAARKVQGRDPKPDPELFSFSMVDLFRYLQAEGAVEASFGYKDFLRAYVDTGKIAGSKMAKPSLESIVAAVSADGGFIVVPHPGHQFNDDPPRLASEAKRLARMLAFFKERGVSGVELYWYGDEGKSEAINPIVRREAEALGLFLTYGSDCHGPGSGKHTIDCFSGDFGAFPGAPADQLPTSSQEVPNAP